MPEQTHLFAAVPPTIRVLKQMLGANNGSSVLLECLVDSFPPALTVWLADESRMIENNWKYKIQNENVGPYSNRVTLNITFVESADYTKYKCIAKSERGKTHALLSVYGIINCLPPSSSVLVTVLFFRNRREQTESYTTFQSGR